MAAIRLLAENGSAEAATSLAGELRRVVHDDELGLASPWLLRILETCP